MAKPSQKPPALSVHLRCGKGHEYTGEPLPFVITAIGAMARTVLLCPFCLLAAAQQYETQVVPELPQKSP